MNTKAYVREVEGWGWMVTRGRCWWLTDTYKDATVLAKRLLKPRKRNRRKI